MVAQSVEGVVDQAASVTQDEKVLQDLGAAATAVTQALNDLLKHIKLGAGPTKVSRILENLYSKPLKYSFNTECKIF